MEAKGARLFVAQEEGEEESLRGKPGGRMRGWRFLGSRRLSPSRQSAFIMANEISLRKEPIKQGKATQVCSRTNMQIKIIPVDTFI